ncbi:type II toxin-antitoxin system RelE family toxin [Gloeothece verrucosa]|uniref:Plasmid stabilization system n=1 Tax=Gloeothece verrucosa (strain PCC 7822) TaxID=497965 RepID=E0UES2_GLOV7|nr:type II toxin-antitoxin system RelE/ParE family toxin [Gloeothece verrucosa]ADN13052.1 plasmid stabilization system [Gloeothece verrucosa PCC 7822]
MTYTIIIPKSVQKQIDALPDEISDRVVEKIDQLVEDQRPEGSIKLKNLDNEYRIRVGDYRVRYEIDDENQVIRLLQCKHRRDVYRK